MLCCASLFIVQVYCIVVDGMHLHCAVMYDIHSAELCSLMRCAELFSSSYIPTLQFSCSVLSLWFQYAELFSSLLHNVVVTYFSVH